MIEEIRIPAERLPILVGKRGQVLKQLRKGSRTLISLKDDIISIEGEALNVWTAKNVIYAIIHDFSPEKALEIIDGKTFRSFDLTDHIPKNRISIIKGRIIGKNGRTREILEEATGAYISVGERHVSFISEEEAVETVSEALEMLISGYSHRVVYRFLQRGKNGRAKGNSNRVSEETESDFSS